MIQDIRDSATYGYQYDAAGRLATLTVNGVVESEYRYDHRGHQVERILTQQQKTTHSIHDLAGNRIAEYEIDALAGTSTLLREYVWMNGRVIAVIEGGVVYYVRSDHIGRPVFATDVSGLKVWEASYLPFGGVHVATAFPGAATDPLDLRFPGQWFQAESGLHQNWMRDYDPTTGRYIQADPLGLVDGASVYGYAIQSPMRWTDPTGEFVVSPNPFIDINGPNSGICHVELSQERLWRVDSDPTDGRDDPLSRFGVGGGGPTAGVTGPGGPVGVGRTSAPRNGSVNTSRTAQETTTVGRWMSRDELAAMQRTGRVQESFSGTTHVTRPASSSAFRPPNQGRRYVEFDVPTSSLRSTSTGFSSIRGPNSIDGRLAIRRGEPVPQMPPATNIRVYP